MSKLASFSLSFFLVLIAALLQICIAATYNVDDFGAKGDGKTDSTWAFSKAWAAACQSNEDSTVYVPRGAFLLNSISFNGTCKNKMLLQIRGKLFAPKDYKDLTEHQAWIAFYYVKGLTVDGGTIDARGESYWQCKKQGNKCPYPARSFSLQSCNDIHINGLTSYNSEAVHVFLNGCNNVTIQNLTIIAPGDSPNTDGIHIGNSNDINVLHSTIGTGDDCISIGSGTRRMYMDHITCGPGHGISIGSIGGIPNEDGVEYITVNNSIFTNTDNGVRIKTWAKPDKTWVYSVKFENLQMYNVANPIIIDQEYCPQRNCTQGSSGVKLSDVRFGYITGTSRSQEAVQLLCSSTDPCEVTLEDINLSYVDKSGKTQPATARCQNAWVTKTGVVIPSC